MDRFRPRELPKSDFRERYEETDVANLEAVGHETPRVQFWCVEKGEAGGWLWIRKGSFLEADRFSFGVKYIEEELYGEL